MGPDFIRGRESQGSQYEIGHEDQSQPHTDQIQTEDEKRGGRLFHADSPCEFMSLGGASDETISTKIRRLLRAIALTMTGSVCSIVSSPGGCHPTNVGKMG